MFNQDFYPTPQEVAEQMLCRIDITGKIVLEPSAGKGDLVKVIKSHGADRVLGCEIHPDLRTIAAKHCNIIKADFLTVEAHEVSHIHAIIGNPPFSTGAKHILHAFKIAPDGCDIIMLCNYATLSNRYSSEREELKSLIDTYGTAINLGNCFGTAERTTDVAVGLVHLKKGASNPDVEFSGFFMGADEDEGAGSNGIMSYNVVRDIVNRYVAACRLFKEQQKLGVQMNELVGGYFDNSLAFTVQQQGVDLQYNNFKKEIQKKAWSYVIDKMNLNKYSTAGLKADINKFVEHQQSIPFTMRNIYHMIDIVIGTASQRMDKAIMEVFEKITKHHDENRWQVEGWKTNSHYLINEKFIMPQISTIGWHGELKIRSYDRYSNYELVEDLTKALCYITGKNYADFDRLDKHVDETHPTWGTWFDWAFFEIRCYKKGTCHFKFKDKQTWAMLNQNIARIMGYPLPEFVTKKK